MKFRFDICGLVGFSVLLLFITICQILYPNFNFTKIFISQLGDFAFTSNSLFFNVAILLGGISLSLFSVGFGITLRHLLGKFGLISGLFSGITGALVGVFPMELGLIHGVVAYCFFGSSIVTILLFTLSSFQQRRKIPKGEIIVLTIAQIGCAIYYFASNLPLFEWGTYYLVTAWILFTSLWHILKHFRAKRAFKHIPKSITIIDHSILLEPIIDS